MKSLYVNNDGDIELDKLNKLKMIDGNKEIAQRNRIILSTNRGEWFLDKTFGLPWIVTMSDKKKTERDYEEIIKKEIESDSDIKEVTKINIDRDKSSRFLKIEFEAKLVNDETVQGKVEV